VPPKWRTQVEIGHRRSVFDEENAKKGGEGENGHQ
jgi:hypothetical protein